MKRQLCSLISFIFILFIFFPAWGINAREQNKSDLQQAYHRSRSVSLKNTAFALPAAQPENLELIGHIGGRSYAIAIQGDFAYVGEGPRLTILDISNPSEPIVVGKSALFPNYVKSVAVSDGFAYVATETSGLRILDISDPAVSTEVGSYDTPGNAIDVAVSGDYAYVADDGSGLRVVDISNPTAPVEVGFYYPGDYSYGVVIDGNYAYVANGNIGLRVVDISNPTAPVEVGFYDTQWTSSNVAVSEGFAYVADEYGGLRVVDVSNPTAPIEVGFYETPGRAWDVAFAGIYAYVADLDNGLRVIDVSNPTMPIEVGFIDTPGNAWGIAINGDYAHIVDLDRGFRVIDISNPIAPVEIGFYDTPGLPRRVKVVGSYAYIADRGIGLRVVDISNPTMPEEVGLFETPDSAFGLAVFGDFAYIADGYSGLRVINVSNPNDSIEVGFYDTPGIAWGVDVAGSFAYIADGYSGLRVVDISNPEAPEDVSVLDTPGFARGVTIDDGYAYVADDFSGLRVIDISNPTAPVEVGFIDTPGGAISVVLAGGYAYIADGTDGLRVVDVSTPTLLTEVGFYDTEGISTDLTITNDFVYIADGSGLRVVDISNPTIPEEVGLINMIGVAYGVTVSEGYVYVACEYSGLFILSNASGGVSYSISGRITDGNSNPIEEVTLTTISGTTSTDVDGYYSFTNLISGTYGITPTKLGYSFSPVSRIVVVPPDTLNQDFVANPTGLDLIIDRIEVRQTFISDNDPVLGYNIPLIADKATMVRVYIGVSGADSVNNVTAHLYIQEGNGQIHEMVNPIVRPTIVARPTPNPLDLSSTINFSPLPQWLQGDVTIWAVVDPDNLISESDETNNTSMGSIIQFHPNNSLRIAWVTFGYRPINLTDYVDFDIADRGDQYLSKIYPIGSANLDYFFQPGFYQVMTQTFTSNAQDYIQALNRFWDNMQPEDWVGGVTPNRLFGWYPGSARDPASGCGNGPGPVAVGPDYCDKEFDGTLEEVPEDQVFAHEIGHTLGLPHTPNDDGNIFCLSDVIGADNGFPRYPGYPWGSIGIHGLDVTNTRIHYPFSSYDFMSYCQNWWMSTYNYQKLDEALIQMISKPPDTFQTSERQLLVSGYLFTPTLSVEFDPFYAITSTIVADISTGTEYCIEMRDNASTPIDSRCFDLGFRDEEEGNLLEYEGFSLAVPYPISTTQIALTHDGIPLELVNVSANSPQVALIYPNGGEAWSATGTYTVTWNSSDLDGEALFHKLFYSANGGISWVPVAYDIPTQSYSMNMGYLPGGSQILLRIAATDGVNTSYDESDGYISVGKKPPTAIIYYPEPGKTILPGTAIVFKGKGYDLEDGTLIDTQLIWSSNIDGYLGEGREVIGILSPGFHIISLSVTDNDGNSSNSNTQVIVGHPVYLPLSWR